MSATLVSKEYEGHSLLKHYKWTMPTIAAGEGSGSTELSLDQPLGDLQGVHIVAPGSLDFNVSIYQKSGVSTYDTDLIYFREGMTYFIKEMGLVCPFENQDTTQVNKLYLVIDNDDGANATGAIEVDLYIRER